MIKCINPRCKNRLTMIDIVNEDKLECPVCGLHQVNLIPKETKMTWTELQVRYMIIGMLVEHAEIGHGISVEQCLKDMGGKKIDGLYDRYSVCRDLDISESQGEHYIMLGGGM